MKSLLLILFIPFASSPVRYRQLTWADYKGKPTNDHLASTCSGIVIESDTAYAVFEPDKSWTRTNDAATLRHEQLHFKITEYWARAISQYGGCYDSRDNEYSGVVLMRLNQWDEMERLYDKETDHGNNVEAQARWEREIKSKM